MPRTDADGGRWPRVNAAGSQLFGSAELPCASRWSHTRSLSNSSSTLRGAGSAFGFTNRFQEPIMASTKYGTRLSKKMPILKIAIPA